MSNDQISSLLSIVLIVMLVVLFLLVIIYFIVRAKTNPKKEKKTKDNLSRANTKTSTQKSTAISYNKQSIYSFMEFDKIEDNMIVRKNGNKFLMVIECQGVNYDLMSGLEKNSVEQGFIQFLNTLRYPIQIYVQTRTVNLESGIIKYKDRINAIRDRLQKKQMEYARKEAMGYSPVELNKARLEVTREQNLYEYGVDLVNNTERMSLNKNILRKHYYIIIDYVPEDINTSDYGKDEITGMAFSELYTKAQAIAISILVVLFGYVLIKESSYASFFTFIKLEIFAIVFFSITYFLIRGNKKAWCYCMSIVAIVAGATVNPICIGTSPLYETKISQAIQEIKMEDPDALWAGNTNITSQYLIANGVDCLNGVHTYPSFGWLKKIDPEGKYDYIYNRYAHIHITLGEETSFVLLVDDSYQAILTYDNVKELGIKYYYSSGEMPDEIINEFKLEPVYSDKEAQQYIYKIN